MQIVKLDRDWYNKDRKPAEKLTIVKRKPNLAPAYLTVKEVAQRLKTSVYTVYDFINAGDLQYQPLGKRSKRISPEELENFLIVQDRKYNKHRG